MKIIGTALVWNQYVAGCRGIGPQAIENQKGLDKSPMHSSSVKSAEVASPDLVSENGMKAVAISPHVPAEMSRTDFRSRDSGMMDSAWLKAQSCL